MGLALDPDKAFRHYVADRWGIEQGLPQLSVLSITQDTTGYLWVTTQNGVARFDGVRFRVFNIENTPALSANIIERVHLGNDGGIWFGSSRGLTLHKDGIWSKIDLIPAQDVAVHALLNGPDSSLLVGTDHGLFERSGSGTLKLHLAGQPVRSLARAGKTLYAGSNGVIYELRSASERALALPGGADAPAVMSLLAAPDGLYAGTRRGIYRWVEGRFETPGWAQPLAQHRIEGLFRDSESNLWIGTTEGLYRYHIQRGLERCLTPMFPDTAWVSSFFEDREGNLWIGSLTHSLARLWNGWASRTSVEDGLSDSFVWSVVADATSAIWVGTNTGVERINPDNTVELIVSTRTLPDSSVYNLFRASNQDLLIGTRAGMARWDGRELTRPALWDAFANAGVRAIAEISADELWIGTSLGLFHQQSGSLLKIGADAGLHDDRIRALLQAQRDELWVGSERGLYLGAEGRFTRIQSPPQMAPALITAILPWRGSRVIVASMDAGLFIGGINDFRQITTAQGLPYNGAFALAVDDSWLYVTSPEGVYRLSLGELERFHLEGGQLSADMVIQTGTEYPGAMRSRCCNGGAQARIARVNGALWLPTLDGALRLDTNGIRRSSLSPAAVIESIEHLGTSYESSNNLQLDGSSGDVAIAYSGLALQDPLGLRFRYRLLGYDETWRSAGSRRTAYYTNLAPGDYQFETVATSSAGLDSPKPAHLAFRLVPPFYRALWFKLLGGLALGALVALGSVAYRHRQQAREHYLEALVMQRTLDLDRANERLRAANRALVEESHTDTLTGLRNRRFLAHYMSDWRRDQSVGKAQRLAFIVVDLDHFKRVNDVHGHLAGDEVLRQVAQVLVELAGPQGIALRWGGEEFMLMMPAESISDAAAFCERLRLRIAEREFTHSQDQVAHLSASAGYALFPALADKSDADDWNLALELADAGLYLMKSSGRNGWAIVHARAHARVADFTGGFSGRLWELSNAGLVLVETMRPHSLPGKSDSRPARLNLTQNLE